MASTSAFKFSVEVGEPVVVAGASASFLVEVYTNLSEYSDHGVAVQTEAHAEAEPEASGDEEAIERAGEMTAEEDGEVIQTALTLCSERRIRVHRTYSDFVALRTALLRLPGSRDLPQLPGKVYFSGADEATLQKRRAAFQSLLAHVGANEALACAQETCSFLSDATTPDYAAVHADALQRMRDVLALPAEHWIVQYSKNDINIAIQQLEASNFYLIRSSVRVPLPVDVTHAHYTETANWTRWTPDAQFTEVERVSPQAAVLCCLYKIPVICNRDVVFYESQVPAEEGLGIPPDLAVSGARAAVAISVAHPMCPARRNVVRARLLIAVTLFTPADNGDTIITSIQHADPRGSIPARVVNSCVARGKVQLKAMRRVMVELGEDIKNT